MSTKTLIYFDTSTWNHLYTFRDSISAEKLQKYDICFSSCNLDEFCIAESDLACELARFSWGVSNKKKLLDHIELSHKEIYAHLGLEPFSTIYDFEDISFQRSWNAIINGSIPETLFGLAHEDINAAKTEFKNRLSGIRTIFQPVFSCLNAGDLIKWKKMLGDLYSEGLVSELLWNNIRIPELSPLPIEYDKFRKIEFRSLPATAAFSEYFFAINYLASFSQGKVSKPNRGDQFDFRHAAYSGYADIFVTKDTRMQLVLNDMVMNKKSKIMGADQFLSLIKKEN